MVNVLMRYQHGIDALDGNTAVSQPLCDARRADAGIDEQPHTVQFYIHRVSLAPAGQYGYLQRTAPSRASHDIPFLCKYPA